MRLDAVAGPLQQRLFQVAIAQPSDRGNRDRDQRNHRDGKPGCERHVGGRSPSRSARQVHWAESDAMAHYGEEATLPGGRGGVRVGGEKPPPGGGGGEPRPAASRQPVTAASRSAGRNGFCRLEIAPSLVAMVRKSGAVSASEEIGRPEMTMIGICGRCWRTIRMVLNPSIPGMKMSRNNRSKSPVRHNTRPFRPSSAVTTLWPARSSNRRTVTWTAASSSTTSILAKVKSSPGPAGIKSTASCEFCRILALSQLLPRPERSGWAVKKPVLY